VGVITNCLPCVAESSRTGGPLSVSTGPTLGNVGMTERAGAVLSAVRVSGSREGEQAKRAAASAAMVRMTERR
jgi:hypothetical protein